MGVPVLTFSALNIPLIILCLSSTRPHERDETACRPVTYVSFLGRIWACLSAGLISVGMRATTAVVFLICIILTGQGIGPVFLGLAGYPFYVDSLRSAPMATKRL